MPFDFELSDPTIVRLGITLLIILGFFMVSRIVLRIIPKYIEDHTRRYRTSKIIKRSAATAAIICIIIVISPGTTEFLTVLTLIGAGLAIALREVLLCLFGWANLTFSAVYKQGDRIEINGVCGDVIDIRILRSTMMEIRNWVDADQSTGRIVHIPNSWTLQHAVYNYSHGFNFIWNEIPFTVTFRSDWDAAQEIMLSLAQVSADIVEEQAKEEIHNMSRDFLIHYSILKPFVYVNVVENGIRLTLRYLCEVRKRRGTTHALTIGILDAFKAHGNIELAYPMMGLSNLQGPQFGPSPNQHDYTQKKL